MRLIDADKVKARIPDEWEDVINDIPDADLDEALSKYTIVGYNFKELVVFAEACKRSGISDKDLREFCLNVEGTIRYVMNKMVAEVDSHIRKGDLQ